MAQVFESASVYGFAGIGKGTALANLEKLIPERVHAISSGDEIRRARREGSHSPLDRLLRRYYPPMDAGLLLPAYVIKRVIDYRLEQIFESAPDGYNLVVLDGTPRTLRQINTLDRILHSHSGTIRTHRHLFLDGDRATAESRLGIRVSSQGVEARADDMNQEAKRRRLDLFETETMRVVEALARKGKLITVDARQTEELVAFELFQKLVVPAFYHEHPTVQVPVHNTPPIRRLFSPGIAVMDTVHSEGSIALWSIQQGVRTRSSESGLPQFVR